MKEIKLPKGLCAQVSDEDYEWLNQFKWRVRHHKYTSYAYTEMNEKTVQMHRLIMKLTDPKIMIDHKDHNGLNNQRSNLRKATRSQNGVNQPLRNGREYKGVYDNGWGAWSAVCIKDQKRYTKTVKCKQYAALLYNEMATDHHGEFAVLNKLSQQDIDIVNQWLIDNPYIEPDNENHKRCRKCQEYKEWSQFYKRTQLKDGHEIWCKKCKNESNVNNARKRRNKIKMSIK